MVREFDPEKHFLGPLCRHGHDWEGTGQSVRSLKGKCCVICNRLKASAYLKTEKGKQKKREYKRSEKYRQYEREYRRKNVDRMRQRDREYNQRDYVKARVKAHTQTEQFRAQQKRYRESEKGQATRKSHRDAYNQRPEVKAAKREYDQRLDIKLKRHKYQEVYRGTESRKAALRRYYLSDHGRAKILNNTRRRRAKKSGNHASGYNSEQLQQHFERFGSRCAYCESDLPLTADHLLPISLGGSDCLGNVVPACSRCNISKNNRDVLTWFQSQPFWSKRRWQKILRLLGKSEDNYNQIPLL